VFVSPTGTQPHVDVETRGSQHAGEVYITARPACDGECLAQAAALCETVAAVLDRHDAAVMHERHFATEDGLAALGDARAKALAAFDDGVPPTRLLVPPSQCGEISGITVHAVAGCGRPKVLPVGQRPGGRLLEMGAWSYLAGCDLQGDGAGEPGGQARQMLDAAESLLRSAGGSLHDVARTWMWLGDILDWYGEFNRVRSELFIARGLLLGDGGGRLPASTGIGIGPAGPRCCAMDLVATLGEAPRVLLSATRQDAASKYGSAFSRAAVARTPAGRTVYISGTAAIDRAGNTTHLDDAAGQIHDTLMSVWTALRDAGSCPEDVVQAIVYCKTPQVRRIFRRQHANMRMPHLVTVADVCRENLLFEVEATAMTKT